MSELLVDAIYEASVITKNWPAILCRLANLIGGSHGVLVSTTGTKFDWVASSDAYSEIVKHNYRHPEGPNRTRMLLEKKHSGFLTESDIWTDAELSQSSLYQDFLYPRSLGRSAATAIFTPNGDSFILHTDSPPSLGPITPEQIAVLDEYRPHLARAVLLSARLGFERAVAAANALDEVGLAAALLGVRGKTIYANDHMASLIPAVVQDRHDRFTIIDKRADSLLSGLLAEISSTGSRTRIGSIPIEAASDQPPSVLHLIPVRGVVRDIFSTAKLIAVITPLMQKIMPDASILQGLFDLTPSEAKVAKGLGDGMTIEQISQSMNIKASTCRFYMKRVITKTGTGRQAVLAGLLQNIAPPFR